jgi:uncharacterized SAM-binding protein YcdF (DUF218 family)
VRILLGIGAGLLVVWLVACAFVFVWPDEDEPASSDAVVVLAGGKKERLAEGLELIRRGVSRTLVISDGNDPNWPEANRLCNGGGAVGFRVVCFRPDPYSTWGEAEAVARLGREHGWRSIAIVTSRFHVSRARMLFERCFPGRVEAIGVPYNMLYLPRALVFESGKTAVALTLRRDCET